MKRQLMPSTRPMSPHPWPSPAPMSTVPGAGDDPGKVRKRSAALPARAAVAMNCGVWYQPWTMLVASLRIVS